MRKDLTAATLALCVEPGIGSAVSQASARDVRRFYLDRIGYWVYYRARGARLEIPSVWHASRGAGLRL